MAAALNPAGLPVASAPPLPPELRTSERVKYPEVMMQSTCSAALMLFLALQARTAGHDACMCWVGRACTAGC